MSGKNNNAKTIKTVITIFLVIAATIGGYYAYGVIFNKDGDKDEQTTEVISETADTEESSSTVKSSNLIWMGGRSVMEGFFDYLGGDTETPVKKDGYTLVYKNLYDPPDIVDSVDVYLKDKGDTSPVFFFKFCFVDFLGGSRSAAEDNLAEHKQNIQSVYDLVVKDNNLKLLIGNSLPQTQSEADEHLLWNHTQYNNWLEDFENSHKGEVAVFDFYGNLTDSVGYLKPEYAVSSDDAHLNEVAYKVLDEKFFEFLSENLE